MKVFEVKEIGKDTDGFVRYNVLVDDSVLATNLKFRDAQTEVEKHIKRIDNYYERCILGSVVVQMTGDEFINQQIDIHTWEAEGGSVLS
jgi:hypothetical protein